MATTFERSWPDVLIGPISVSNHIVTLPNVNGLHTKQKITLQLGSQTEEFEIKRILSPTTIKVGPRDSNLFNFSNPVGFTGGILWASEQPRNTIAVDPIIRNVYEEEPAVAIRTVSVDRYGQFYSVDNPLPVRLSDGSINIESLNANLSVQLSHLDNFPTLGNVHDSVRIGGPNGTELVVNLDGSINTQVTSSVLPTGAATAANQVTQIGQLTAINNAINALPQNNIISGTENGQPNGPEFVFVNNRVQQILKAKDRSMAITYADFGNKNQRITMLDYTAPSIGTGPGFTARKTIAYTQVYGKYRRDSITWSLV
jgi:hypothetical protein